MAGAFVSIEAVIDDTTWLRLGEGRCLGCMAAPFDCQKLFGLFDGKFGEMTSNEMRSRRPTSKRPLMEGETMTLVLIV